MPTPVLAVIADPKTPNCAELLQMLPELEGQATCLLGNDVESFASSALLPEVEAIVVAVFAGGRPALLAQLWPLCPKVRWVHSMAAGVDTIAPVLLGLPGGRDVPLTNAKGAFSRSLAEYGIAAMLHFNKQVPRLQRSQKTQLWEKFQMNQLFGKTAGFVGFGDIAQATARLCKAFGMRVIAVRRTSGGDGADLADKVLVAADGGVLEVFREADFVICSLPGGPNTRHCCGRREFEAARPGSVFVSLGRGSCVDEAALFEALQSGRLAGAALDVFEQEPLPATSPLWQCENLLISPHNADLTDDYMRSTWDLFKAKLSAFASPTFRGFDSVVDKDQGY